MAAKTVTRADLMEAIYREVGLSRNESAQLVETVLDEISKALTRGQAVKISSFGSFSVREKAQRVGRNLKTGELEWIQPSGGSLASLYREPEKRQYIAHWAEFYIGQGPQNMIYENSTVGLLSTDNSRVYVVDDMVLPPHPNYMQQWAWGGQPNFGAKLQQDMNQSMLHAIDLQPRNRSSR